MTKDEKKHFLYIYILTIVIVVLFRIRIDPLGWSVYNMYNWDCGIALFIGVAISIGKEVIYDNLLGKGTPQFYDAVWGSIGALLGPATVLLIEGIVTMFI